MTVKEYRELLKKRHLCRDCKTQDAYTLAGRTYCFDCADKQRMAKITNSQYIISCDNSRCIASEIKAVYIEYGSAIQAWNRRETEK